MWYRVFGRSSVEPAPAALASHLHAAGLPVKPYFRGDDLGWVSGELRLPGPNATVFIERYLTTTDEIRDDLNSHAAILETSDSPNAGMLMERVIQTQQLFVVRMVDDAEMEKVLLDTCRFLAAATDGVYQIDGQGWFAASGEQLVQEQ